MKKKERDKDAVGSNNTNCNKANGLLCRCVPSGCATPPLPRPRRRCAACVGERWPTDGRSRIRIGQWKGARNNRACGSIFQRNTCTWMKNRHRTLRLRLRLVFLSFFATRTLTLSFHNALCDILSFFLIYTTILIIRSTEYEYEVLRTRVYSTRVYSYEVIIFVSGLSSKYTKIGVKNTLLWNACVHAYSLDLSIDSPVNYSRSKEE